MATPLKLYARELEDMSVISSMCQDALVSVADFKYSPETKSFLLILNRFCWEPIGDTETDFNHRRTHAVLHFEAVEAVAYKKFRKNHTDQILSLLAIVYAEEPDGSIILLQFSEDTAIRLSVETLNVTLQDIGESWITAWKPEH